MAITNKPPAKISIFVGEIEWHTEVFRREIDDRTRLSKTVVEYFEKQSERGGEGNVNCNIKNIDQGHSESFLSLVRHYFVVVVVVAQSVENIP